MSTVRSTARAPAAAPDGAGEGAGVDGALTHGAFAARRAKPASDGADQPAGQPRDAEEAGPHVGADHRPDLRDDRRLAAEDRTSALGQLLGHLRRLDVLDEEDVAARVAPVVHVLDHALERAP